MNQPGRWIGPYRVISHLGAGGVGAVFKALAPDGTEVAVKVLMKSSPEAQRRFQREQRMLAQLGEESGFLPLLDTGTCPQGLYVVMPLCPGGDLSDRLAEKGPLPTDAALDLARQVASALSRAHALGIIHRDLKPANILFAADGWARVADLGLAKLAESEADSLSRTGELRGTIGYMAPEQMSDAKHVGPAADVFAWGAIVYEVLSGMRAFAGATAVECLARVAQGEFEPLDSRSQDLPPSVVHLVSRCLALDPAKRPADGAELLEALEHAEANPAYSPDRKRKSMLAALFVSAFVVLAIAGALLWSRHTTEPEGPQEAAGDPSASDPLPPGVAPPGWTLRQRTARAPGAHRFGVRQLVLDRKGKRALTLGLDHQVRAWNLEDGALTRRLPSARVPLDHLAVLPDGAVVAGGAGGAVWWPDETRPPRPWKRRLEGSISALNVSEAGTILVSHGKTLSLLRSDGASGAQATLTLPPMAVASTATGDFLVCLNNIFRMQAGSTASPFRSKPGRLSALSAAVFLSGPKTLVGAREEGGLLWVTRDTTSVSQPVADTPATALAVAGAGVLEGDARGHLRRWSWPDKAPVELGRAHLGVVRGVVHLPDGGVLSVSELGRLRRGDPEGKTVWSRGRGPWFDAAGQGRKLITLGPQGCSVYDGSAAEKSAWSAIETPHFAAGAHTGDALGGRLRLSPDAKHALIVTRSALVLVDVARAKATTIREAATSQSPGARSDAPFDAAFHPGGAQVAVSTPEGCFTAALTAPSIWTRVGPPADALAAAPEELLALREGGWEALGGARAPDKPSATPNGAPRRDERLVRAGEHLLLLEPGVRARWSGGDDLPGLRPPRPLVRAALSSNARWLACSTRLKLLVYDLRSPGRPPARVNLDRIDDAPLSLHFAESKDDEPVTLWLSTATGRVLTLSTPTGRASPRPAANAPCPSEALHGPLAAFGFDLVSSWGGASAELGDPLRLRRTRRRWGRVVGLGAGGVVRVWDATTGSVILSLETGRLNAIDVALLEDARTLALLDADGGLLAFDLERGGAPIAVRHARAGARAMADAGQGQLVLADATSVRLLDLRRGQTSWLRSAIGSTAIAAAGDTVAVAGARRISHFDRSGRSQGSAPFEGPILHLGLTQRGDLAVGAAEMGFYKWRFDPLRGVGRSQAKFAYRGVDFDPEGSFVTLGNVTWLQRRDTPTFARAEGDRLRVTSNGIADLVQASSDEAITVDAGGSLDRWSFPRQASTWKHTDTLREAVVQVGASRRGDRLVVATQSALYSGPPTGPLKRVGAKIPKQLPRAQAVRVSPSGKRALVLGPRNLVVYELSTGEILSSRIYKPESASNFTSAIFVDDERLLQSSGVPAKRDAGDLVIYAIAGKRSTSLGKVSGAPRAIAPSGDGKDFLVVSRNGDPCALHYSLGVPAAPVKVLADVRCQDAFSTPQGELVILTGEDEQILFDPRNPHVVLTLQADAPLVSAACPLDTGRWAVVQGARVAILDRSGTANEVLDFRGTAERPVGVVLQRPPRATPNAPTHLVVVTNVGRLLRFRIK